MKKLVFFIFLHIPFQLLASVIIIDPGHGGHDQGAKMNITKSNQILEKDLVQKVANLLAAKISKKHKVYLTRNSDQYVSLEDRVKVAEENNGDIFVSIHANYASNKTAEGMEIFYLGENFDVTVNKIEELENKEKKKDSEELKIIIELLAERVIPESKELAEDIHKELTSFQKRSNISDRGTKQGLFYVLAMAKRPAVLIEIGFLSNPQEVKKMISPKFMNDFSQKLAKGIEKYLKKKEKMNNKNLPFF